MIKPDHRIKTAMLAGIAVFMAGCASTPDSSDTAARSDPYESVNRSVFAFNLAVDDYALEPAAKALRKSPDAVQTGLRNHVDWAAMPKTAVNSALQGKGENAVIATLNFAINSLTFGFVDLLEGEERPASDDFGQTLASAGAEEGPYIVAPLLGGQTTRALAGWGVDFILNPYGQLTQGIPADLSNASIPISATSIRATYFDAINDVKYNSLDPYARARSAYYQQRDGLLRNNLSIDETNSDFDSFFE